MNDEVKKAKRSIVVAIINNMPFIQTSFFESATALLFETSKTTELAWMNVKTFPVDFARNWAIRRFLNAGAYKSIEWFGWLDIDMTFPKDAFNMLLDECEKTGAKVMSGVYFKRNFNNEVVGWKYGPNRQMIEPVLDGSVQEVEVIGMGCCVIHRSVLEKMMYPWYGYGAMHEDVQFLSTEDVYFCERCAELKEKIFIHTGVICGHLMTIENIHNKIIVRSMSDGPAEKEI
jgi:hypothetical protein